MNKNITVGIDALKLTALSTVRKQIESGKMVPTTFSSLNAPEKLYVKLITFERRSPEEACRIIAKKLNAAGSPVAIDPEELRSEYMFNNTIKMAMREIVSARDDEYSLAIQQSGRVAEKILGGLMLNSQDEEIQLKAAAKIADLAAKDYADKRGKTKIDITQSTTKNTFEWNIHTYDKSKDQAVSEQKTIDATVVTIEEPKPTEEDVQLDFK